MPRRLGRSAQVLVGVLRARLEERAQRASSLRIGGAAPQLGLQILAQALWSGEQALDQIGVVHLPGQSVPLKSFPESGR
jgi:hypothetical protein